MLDYEIAEELKKKVKTKYPELYKKLENKDIQIDLASVVNIRDDHYASLIDKKKNKRLRLGLRFRFNKENSKIRYVEIFDPADFYE